MHEPLEQVGLPSLCHCWMDNKVCSALHRDSLSSMSKYLQDNCKCKGVVICLKHCFDQLCLQATIHADRLLMSFSFLVLCKWMITKIFYFQSQKYAEWALENVTILTQITKVSSMHHHNLSSLLDKATALCNYLSVSYHCFSSLNYIICAAALDISPPTREKRFRKLYEAHSCWYKEVQRC